MANASSTGFGMKPVKMAGQSANTAGLGEYPVAASCFSYLQPRFGCDGYKWYLQQ